MRKMNLVCGLLAIALGQIVWADQPAKSDCDIDAGSNQCMLDQVNAEFVKADAARYAAYEQLFGYVQTNPDVNEITTSGAGSFASVISRAEQSWKKVSGRPVFSGKLPEWRWRWGRGIWRRISEPAMPNQIDKRAYQATWY